MRLLAVLALASLVSIARPEPALAMGPQVQGPARIAYDEASLPAGAGGSLDFTYGDNGRGEIRADGTLAASENG